MALEWQSVVIAVPVATVPLLAAVWWVDSGLPGHVEMARRRASGRRQGD